jgi:hypothetical protein
VLESAKGSASFNEQFLYPVLGSGGDVARFGTIRGRFELTGTYAATLETRFRWLERTGQQESPVHDELSEWYRPYPVFLVRAWCYVPPDDLEQSEKDELSDFLKSAPRCHRD